MTESDVLRLLERMGLTLSEDNGGTVIVNNLKCGEVYINPEGIGLGTGTKLHCEIDGFTTIELLANDGIVKCGGIDIGFFQPE